MMVTLTCWARLWNIIIHCRTYDFFFFVGWLVLCYTNDVRRFNTTVFAFFSQRNKEVDSRKHPVQPQQKSLLGDRFRSDQKRRARRNSQIPYNPSPFLLTVFVATKNDGCDVINRLQYFYMFVCNNVSCEFDEFRVDTISASCVIHRSPV